MCTHAPTHTHKSTKSFQLFNDFIIYVIPCFHENNRSYNLVLILLLYFGQTKKPVPKWLKYPPKSVRFVLSQYAEHPRFKTVLLNLLLKLTTNVFPSVLKHAPKTDSPKHSPYKQYWLLGSQLFVATIIPGCIAGQLQLIIICTLYV